MLAARQPTDPQNVPQRFLEAFNSLSDASVPSVAIALSGGSDSLALLHLARQQLADIQITALTVDHNLREESAEEAQRVADWMAALGVTHHILRWQHDGVEGNLQAQARKARYQLMTEWCQQHDVPVLLLGHTQDDQAETIAYQQERAAGPVGLAGMSARRSINGIILLRPLLGHTRQELQNWLERQSIEWLDDPSNDNTDFARVRIRQELAERPERKVELLALGQRMAKQRLEIEQAHADFVEQFVTVEAPILHCPLAEFLALGQDQAAYTLGRMLCHIGGDEYPPRYAKRLHCLQSLQSATPKLTLGHCLIEIAGKTLRIRPEKDSGAGTVKPLVPELFTPIFPS